MENEDKDVIRLMYATLPKLWKAMGFVFKAEGWDNEEKLITATMCLIKMIEGVGVMMNEGPPGKSFDEMVEMMKSMRYDWNKGSKDGH